MKRAFADALALLSTNRVNVLTRNDSVPSFYYEVNLWFNRMRARSGTFDYELRELNNPSIQIGAQDCRDIKQESLIKSVSQQLAREVLPKIDISRETSHASSRAHFGR